MHTPHRLRLALSALGIVLLTACTASTPSKPEAQFNATTLPESCKVLVKNMKACEDVQASAPTVARVCAKRVTERDGPSCPMAYAEAKRIIGGK